MDIGTRIRKVRRELDLTQTEFAEKIGSVQNTVTGYENGRRNPSAPVIALICKEFRVNEKWLRTGEGEMFLPKTASALEELARERGLSHRTYILLEKLLNLRPEVMDSIVDVCLEVAVAIGGEGTVKAEDPAFSSGDRAEMTDADLHAELDRQLAEEKEAADESSAFGRGNSGTAAG